MSIILQSSGGGSVTIQEPSTASNLTATLPAATGTVVLTDVAGTIGLSATGANIVTASTNGSERMRIDSSGNLLVGITSNSYSYVRKSNSTGYVFGVENSANTNGDAVYKSTLGSNCNTTGSYHLICATGSNDKMYVLGNGNLQNVNNSYGTLSDIKLKENVVDATPKLDKLMQLQVRNFNLINDENKLKQIGFVAQEIEQVFPSIIEELPDLDEERNFTGTTTKGVKTSVLIPILVKAIQELNAKVDAQALEIQALKGVA